MKQLLRILLPIFLMTSPAFADSPFSSVQRLFNGISLGDGEMIRSAGTKDFEMLEVGEVWDMDKLVRLVQENPSKSIRRNHFAIITSKTDTDRAWVSYWNKAVFEDSAGVKKGEVNWLESVVLVKKADAWLIEMLHSTRLTKDQNIPDTVQMTEYSSD